MAKTIYPTPVTLDNDQALPTGVHIWKWVDVDSGDTLMPAVVGVFTDKAVGFVVGTAGDGALGLEGTIDPAVTPTTWYTLHDVRAGSNTIASVTATSTYQILENCFQVRPTISGTTGANHTVWLIATTPARR